MKTLFEYHLRTERRSQMIDISDKIREAVDASGIEEGICLIYNPHTTAAVTINENADPDVRRDINAFLNESIPKRASFRHAEGNSDAHIKTSLVGLSLSLIITNARLILGTWQGIYFCEYDGPRNRHFYVKCLADLR